MEKEKTLKYKKGDFTIYWKPSSCIHAAECVKALPNVYDPKGRPWISVDNANTEELKAQIALCPSGALSHNMNEDNISLNKNIMDKPKIAGTAPQKKELIEGKNYAWCTCGISIKQPWCDGSHKGTGFSPKVFKVEEAKTAYMCMCKQTKNPPFCDGSHSSL